MRKSVTDMSNNELLKFGSEITRHNEIIQKEWYKRYQMNFPYALDYEENIVHHIMNCIIQDNECDKLILKQSIDLRDEQSKK